MTKLRLTVVAALAVTAAATGAATGASAAPAPRSGCAVVSDARGDTAADVGAPRTMPQTDSSLDLTAVDLASNAKWIGARLHLVTLDDMPATTGGEHLTVELAVGGGTLIMGVGRYSDPTGITGDGKFAYAGFQRGTLAPRDVPARAVQLLIDPTSETAAVFVDRAALKDIGANVTGTVSGVTATSGRQYADEVTVGYDSAAGSPFYKLGAPSCLRLPSS